MKKLREILLVDDNDADNYLHRIVIEELDCAETISEARDGTQALALLRSAEAPPPEIIFLDINMPRMNGWQFLDAFEKLPVQRQSKVVIVMLTTSLNPDDHERAVRRPSVKGFENKPLTADALQLILSRHFAA
ncbi:MAG: response regulator [Myxococcales bacterium]|nr:response regulator [Myxococcales bacterium]